MEIDKKPLPNSMMEKNDYFLPKHFENGAKRGPLLYGIQMGLESSILSLGILPILYYLGVSSESSLLTELSSEATSKLIFLSIVIAPIFETIFLQFLPISVAARFTSNRRVLLFIGIISFTLLHISNGSRGIIAAGLVGGFFFSAVFVEFREGSIFKAMWATILAHSLHNLISISLFLASRNN